MSGKQILMMTAFLAVWAAMPAAYAQGSLKGRVIFEGTPPQVPSVEVKSDVPVCGSHKETSKIKLGAGRGVAEAVVRVLGAKNSAAPQKGSLDQVQCQFVPHVQALPAGSTLVITSSDAVLHNSHGFNEDGSTAFNIAVPIVGMEVNQKLPKPGIIKLRCDAGHTWMSAYVHVLEEPFAVTDADGNFVIEGLAPGTYEVEVWQEWLGKSKETFEIRESAVEKDFKLQEKK